MMLGALITSLLVSVATLIVLFWRLKPVASADAGTADRAQTLTQQLQELQTKLAMQETTHGNTKVELATSAAHGAAAQQAYGKLQQQYDALQEVHKQAVQGHKQAVEAQQVRAHSQETALSDTRTQLATMQAHYNGSKRTCEEAQQAVKTLQTEHAALQSKHHQLGQELGTAQANHEGLQRQAQGLSAELTRVNGLLSERTNALQSANLALGTAQEQCRQLQQQKTQAEAKLVTLQQDLNKTTSELVEASARLQTDAQAASQFEAVSSRLLRGTMEQAKFDLKGLAQELAQASNDELQKHAAQVTASLKPLQDKLQEYDRAVESFKSGSHDLFGQLKQQLNSLQASEQALHDQALALTTALSDKPKVKGNYGELVLKRLAEFAGMLERCHFQEQDVQQTEEGRRIPDMVFKLPGSQDVIVDAKAVMEACQRAQSADTEEERQQHLRQHCRHVRARVDELERKKYAQHYGNSLNAVILFLPAEHLYAAAMENDPDLTEYAMRKGVLICSPNTLLLLLKTANHLWRQNSIEEEAQKVAKLGTDMYKAACVFLDHYAKLGGKVEQLVEAYNTASGSLNGNFVPKGRRMSEMNSLTIHDELPEVKYVQAVVRTNRSEEGRTLTEVPAPV